jgi:hypothetical protein
MKSSDFINLPWRAVPRLRDVDSKLAVKDPETCNACIIADVVMLAADIPLVMAQHIVDLHNQSIG